MRAGLLDGDGKVVGGRGRPPRRLRLSGSAGHLLVAALGATSADIALTDRAGTVLATETVALAIADGPDAVLDCVDALFDRMHERCAGQVGPLSGIGIGIPGPVETVRGDRSPRSCRVGTDYPIVDRFGRQYDAPVWVDNDVNLLTLGEWRLASLAGTPTSSSSRSARGSGSGSSPTAPGIAARTAPPAMSDISRSSMIQTSSVGAATWAASRRSRVGSPSHVRASGRPRRVEAHTLAAVLTRDGALSVAAVGAAASRGDAASIEMLQRAGRLAARCSRGSSTCSTRRWSLSAVGSRGQAMCSSPPSARASIGGRFPGHSSSDGASSALGPGAIIGRNRWSSMSCTPTRTSRRPSPAQSDFSAGDRGPVA